MVWKKNNLVNVMPADTQQIIDASSLGNASGTTTNCTYSIWIYVNDWSVNYGEEKIIFQRSPSLNDIPDLTVSLGPYETTLSVTAKILGDKLSPYGYQNGTYIHAANGWYINDGCSGTSGISGCENYPYYNDNETNNNLYFMSWSDAYGLSNKENQIVNEKQIEKSCDTSCNKTPNCVGYSYVASYDNCVLLGTLNDKTPEYSIVNPSAGKGFLAATKNTPLSQHTCIVPNIEIQKWVNIILSASTNNIDIYIDGKLIQSCDLGGELNISNTTNVYISPNGKGFNGWNSRFQFLPKYINPHQAMNIYRKGHGSSNIGNLNYSLNVSLTNGSQQIGSVNI